MDQACDTVKMESDSCYSTRDNDSIANEDKIRIVASKSERTIDAKLTRYVDRWAMHCKKKTLAGKRPLFCSVAREHCLSGIYSWSTPLFISTLAVSV